MFKATFMVVLFYLKIKLAIRGKSSKTKKIIFSFRKNDPFDRIALTTNFKIQNINNPSQISFLDIIFRRVLVLHLPSSEDMHSLEDILKRKVIKCLNLDARYEIILQHLIKVFIPDNGTNVFITNARHVADVYTANLPHFNVLTIPDVEIPLSIKKSFELALIESQCNINKSVGVTIFANIASEWILKIYRYLHPNHKIVIRFHDILGEQVGRNKSRKELLEIIDRLRQSSIIDVVESYCRNDANELNGIYRPNGANPDFLKPNLQYREKLFCFIGTNNHFQSGLPARSDVIKQFTEEILRIYPYLNQQWLYNIKEQSNTWITYSDFVKKYALSEVYIDLLRVADNEGYSFRIPEALWLNRKIISNRFSLREEPFYTPERIFLLGYDSFDTLREFLEREIEPLPEKILTLLDARLWYTQNDPLIGQYCKSQRTP